MPRTLSTLILLLALCSPGAAEVLVETLPTPVLGTESAVGSPNTVGARSNDARLEPRSGTFSHSWTVPRFRVDRTKPGDTTLLALIPTGSCAGNPVCGASNVLVHYYDRSHVAQHSEGYDVAPGAVQTINVRDVPGLPVDPDGFSRGSISIYFQGYPGTVDYFQVDTSEDFATGGPAFPREDFCEIWWARFLSFGPGQGSVLSLYVPNPLGGGLSDPPTVTGEVYDESGTFINSFVVRTDQWAFDLEIEDFAVGAVPFGRVKLDLGGDEERTGIVSVRHAAEGRFSIGSSAACRR